MKKLFIILFITGIFSCNSEKKENERANEPGIQNVNGNISDTTNAINLGKDKTGSSSHPNTPD